MAKSNKTGTLLEQNSFLKGLLIGIGSTALIAGIGAFVAYQFISLKRSSTGYSKRMYDYTSEGGIVPESDFEASDISRFQRESEKLARDHEIREKELEEIEEATKRFSSDI